MHIPFNPAVPEGAHTPPVYADEDLANIRALRDAVVSGFMPGWSYEKTFDSGGPIPGRWNEEHTWANGVFRLCLTVGFHETEYYPLDAIWDYSEDSGATWLTITTGGTPIALAVNVGEGTINTADKDSALWILSVSLQGAIYRLQKFDELHALGVGSAVHGLGTLSTQNANALAATGGSIANVKVELAPRITPAAPVNLVSGAAMDWAVIPTQSFMSVGNVVNGFVNAVAGEMKRIWVYAGGGAVTLNAGAGNTLVWAIGHPVWAPSGGTLINIICLTPTYFVATTIPGA